jgi:hypothetical protein
MAKRVCDACGKEEPLEGGRTCEGGHFICKKCVWKGSGPFFSNEKKTCPLCKKPLR